MKKEVKYHLIFWGVYLLTWATRDLVFHPDLLVNLWKNLLFTIATVPFIYINLLYLIPKFLFVNRILSYVLVFLSCVFVSGMTRVFMTSFWFNLVDVPLPESLMGVNGVVIAVSESLILFVISMSVFLVGEWYVKERYAQELREKNTKSELALLKHQLQPHFLFNNLNTIYFLMESDPALAREVMIDLSDLLSHQLYDAKKDRVSLEKELESIKSYLKIQDVRFADFLDLEYDIDTVSPSFQIAPMILITFLENAFKHGQKEDGYRIRIKAKLNGNVLHYSVINTIGQAVDGPGGIGLENVKRRLDLIYTDQHELQIENDGSNFKITLDINLETHEMSISSGILNIPTEDESLRRTGGFANSRIGGPTGPPMR